MVAHPISYYNHHQLSKAPVLARPSSACVSIHAHRRPRLLSSRLDSPNLTKSLSSLSCGGSNHRSNVCMVADPMLNGGSLSKELLAGTCVPLKPNRLDKIQKGHIPALQKDVSRIVYGTLFLNQVADPFSLLDHIWGSGCNAFDCARIYGDGECEYILGEWLKSRGINREEVVVVTKGGSAPQSRQWAPDISEDTILGELDTSLKALQLDFVDSLILHRDDERLSVEYVVDYMSQIIKRGLAKTWGVSNWSIARTNEALAYAQAKGLVAPSIDSPQFSLAEPVRPVWPGTTFAKADQIAQRAEHNLAVFSWECLGKGFLAGKWGRNMANKDLTSLEFRERQIVGAYCVAENFDRRNRLMALADHYGCSPTSLALAYILGQPGEHCFALVGTTKVDHFTQSIPKIQLSPQEIKWLSSGEIEQSQPSALI